jgi:hypothetical protein
LQTEISAPARATTYPGKPSPLEQQERRATLRLLTYWHALRRPGAMPAFGDFDPRRNPVPWENCFLLAVAPTGGLALDHAGSALPGAAASAGAGNGAPLPGLIGEIAGDAASVLEVGEPAQQAGRCTVGPRQAVLYRSVLLPFADLQGRPAYLLGAATWRFEEPPPN